MPRHRIVVIGESVFEVQHVSRCCLKQDIDVFPYYGVPTNEEISLFAPHLVIVCSPILEIAYPQIEFSYILWSEQPINSELPVISNMTELQELLQKIHA